ncbi:hypothetical protein FWC31_03935 [Candidatus Saccharibacteria bacterium]|nr:hypothetical protein [Candidatus Saccharibacteria bacterium]
MKKSDWALVIIIVVVVAVVSWFIIGSILPPPSDEKVRVAPSITSDIQTPENNVILYDANRPSWCPKTGGDNNQNSMTNENDENNSGETISTGDRQYINTVFNSCAINSSFTTTTE